MSYPIFVDYVIDFVDNVKRTHENGNCKWLVEEVRGLRRTISNSVTKVAQNLNISEYITLSLVLYVA
jgi:hypothetical protein